MTVKDLASYIGKACTIRVSAGAAIWHVNGTITNVRLRYGVRDYMVELDGDKTAMWCAEGFIREVEL